MSFQQRDAAIVGIHEFPSRDVEGELSPLHIKAQSASKALADAGLTWSDVDGIYDAGEGGASGLTIAEYFGLSPTVIDTTNVGGSSYQFHAAHARRAIAAGKARVALLTYGSTAHSNVARIGTGGRGMGAYPADNLESFAGLTLIANYAMGARRHMFEFGTTSEQLAEISVATRCHAMRNPDAVRAMEDLEFLDIRETTVDDVVNSRMIADPLHLLECCMISDGGGAVIIAAPDVARDCRHKPVWILGTGEATKYPEGGADITSSAAVQSGPIGFGEAGVGPDEMDIAMIYDSFTVTAGITAEMLGLAPRGEGWKLWADGHASPGGRLPINTNGGGLSFNHSGMYGQQLLVEAYRQLSGTAEDGGFSGDAGKQTSARACVVNGTGGSLSVTGTIVLVAD